MTSTPRIPLLGATLLILCLLVPAVGRSQTALEDALRQLTAQTARPICSPVRMRSAPRCRPGTFIQLPYR